MTVSRTLACGHYLKHGRAIIPIARNNGVPFCDMKRLLPLLTLTSAIWGLPVRPGHPRGRPNASLVGLPEYGVTLRGTVEEPTIVNGSGRTIIGHVLHFEYPEGGGYWRDLKTRGLRLPEYRQAAQKIHCLRIPVVLPQSGSIHRLQKLSARSV